jgi:hypothetical protein
MITTLWNLKNTEYLLKRQYTENLTEHHGIHIKIGIVLWIPKVNYKLYTYGKLIRRFLSIRLNGNDFP